jgi:hypothetical protein
MFEGPEPKPTRLRRLAYVLITMGLPVGVLTGVFTYVLYTGDFACQDKPSLACLFSRQSLLSFGWIFLYCLLVGSIGFGLGMWLTLEHQNRYIFPTWRGETGSELRESSLSGIVHSDNAAEVSIRQIPQVLPMTFLDSWFGVKRNWIIFMDGEPVGQLPPLSHTQISIPPGKHQLYVGYENYSNFWKKGIRSTLLEIELGPEEHIDLCLKYNSLWATSLLLVLFILYAQPLWLPSLYYSIPREVYREAPWLGSLLLSVFQWPVELPTIVLACFVLSKKKLTQYLQLVSDNQ